MFACWALRQSGPVHFFSARLRDDTEEKARTKKNPLKWLRKRVLAELKKFLGRKVKGVFTLEDDEHHRIHLHGELQFSAEEAEVARKAIRRACGEWPVEGDRPRGCPAWVPNMPRQHQVQTQFEPDHGCSCYMAKDFWRARPLMRKMVGGSHLFRLSFDCKPLSVTEEVRERAETLYNQWRAKVIAERRKSKRAARKARKRLALGNRRTDCSAPLGLRRVLTPIPLSDSIETRWCVETENQSPRSPKHFGALCGHLCGSPAHSAPAATTSVVETPASAALRSWSAVQPRCEKLTIVAIFAQFAKSTDHLRF
jgi:hypothetical protein